MHTSPLSSPALLTALICCCGTDYWSSRVNSENEWQFNVATNKDAYHCAGAYCAGNSRYRASRSYCGDAIPPGGTARDCIGWLNTENVGFYYVTISGAFVGSGEDVSGGLVLQFAQPPAEIAAPQLQAIKDLWLQNCWVAGNMQGLPVFNVSGVAPNDFWTRTNHIEGKYAAYNPQPDYLHRAIYSTNGHETDSDTVPFCDWMYEAGQPPIATYNKVMGFTVSSCLAMDYVSCDFAGNVVELRLSSRGLAGPLPSSFGNLNEVKRIELSFNKLNGTLPTSVWSSGKLEHLFVSKNRFSGNIPCPSHAEPKFMSLYIGRNDFTGAFPTCLFSTLPRLQSLDMSYLRLTNAFIPATFANVGHTFVNLFAEHSGLTGPLPRELACMRMVIYFHMGRNSITGFPQYAIDRMPTLYSLDLSFNQLSGAMPHFDNNTELRRIYLENNMLTGDFTAQLAQFATYQDAGALSAAHLSNNGLSGPLPQVLYNLKTNAHRLTTVDVAGNHFRCDGDSGLYPAWARRIGATSSFGRCAKVPKVVSVSGNIVPGGLMYVTGSDFVASAELRCRMGMTLIMPASYISPTSVACPLPEAGLVRGMAYDVSVANYGDDWYDASTHPGTYVAVSGVVAGLSPPPSPPAPPSPTAPAPFWCESSSDLPCMTGSGLVCLRVVLPSACPTNLDANTPNCQVGTVPIGGFCEADGECGTGNLDNCPGGYDVYMTIAAVTTGPPPPPTTTPLDGGDLLQMASGSASAVGIVGIVLGILGLIAIVLAAFFTYRHFKNKATSTVVKAVPVESVSATSATTGADVEMKSEESKV